MSVQFNNGGNSTTTPGTSVSINGTIINNASSSAVYLNSVANLNIIPSNSMVSATSGLVAIDQAASASYVPMVLNAGQQYTNALVKINISSSALPGDYMGAYTLNAGTSSTTNEFVQTQYFVIHVVAPDGTTPPPADTTVPSGLQMPAGLEYQDVADSSAFYQNGPRLIKLDGSNVVYWVNPMNLKIPMWTDAVFKSYNSNPEEVQVVSQEEFDFYQNVKYVRLLNNSRIYKIEGQVKRFIPSSVWNPAGIDPSLIIDINKTDFNSYKNGKNLTSGEELN